MSRTRWWTAVGIVGVLALAAGWMIWRDRSTPGPTTTLLAAPTTTPEPSTTVAISTTVETRTAATTQEQREAEVEQILTDLWFGWFDAIYRKDADALWQVVATTPYHQAGATAMSTLRFTDPPSASEVAISDLEILLDRPDCLVAFYQVDFSRIIPEEPSQTVSVMWPEDSNWRFASQWLYPNDLWQADCDDLVREEVP